MRSTISRMGLAMIVLMGVCSVADAAPRVMPQCSPLGVPCTPPRVTYGYVPTTWRRWPIDYVATTSPPSEAVPTPAQPELPTVEPETTQPESNEALPEPSAGPPEPPDDDMIVPFGEGPAGPAPRQAPLAPAFEEAPVAPFEDAPPRLPSERATPTEPNSDAARPEEPLPTSTGARPEGGAGLPTMPDDDPFKDDPDTGAGAKPTPASKPTGTSPPAANGSTRQVEPATEVELQISAARRRMSQATGVLEEPRRLEGHGEGAPLLELPDGSPTGNPLRAHQAPRRQSVVPTSGYSPEAPRSGWRSNPLRPQ